MSIAYSVVPPIRASPHFSSTIRSSNAEGPLRRPSAPATSYPSPSSVVRAPPPKPVKTPVGTTTVTVEFQRKMAKEMQDYFRMKKVEETDQGPAFGFVPKNEISNGRWAMFGFAVGLLTEYATGSDFVQQVKILFSNFGIIDLD